MSINRRQFLTTVASLSLTACSDGIRIRPDPNLIIGGGQFLAPGSRSAQFVLSILEFDKQQQQIAPMSFLPHGIHSNPADKQRLAIFEKIGPGACEFDLSSRQVVRPIQALSGHQFYGHGAYSADGKLLYATESAFDTRDGVISVRDATDHRVLGQFPSYGKAPHECKLIDQGKTMMVTNGGGAHGDDAPSLSYIDVASTALLKKITLRNEDINAGHVAINAAGNVVVVSAPRAGLDQRSPGGVSMSTGQDRLLPADAATEIREQLLGEALSVAIHDASNLVAVSHPDGNLLTLWSLTDRRLIKTIQLPGPRGVELSSDQSSFIVSFGSQASVLKIPVDTLEPDSKSTYSGTFITGSHIYNHANSNHELAYASGFRS